jgi:hypothetical protein
LDPTGGPFRVWRCENKTSSVFQYIGEITNGQSGIGAVFDYVEKKYTLRHQVFGLFARNNFE